MEKPWYMFIFDYFMDDLWNTMDVACIVINGLVINSIMRLSGDEGPGYSLAVLACKSFFVGDGGGQVLAH